MTFREDGGLDTGGVSGGGGGGGRGMAIGGGVGGVVIVILGLIFGIDPGQLGLGGSETDSGQSSSAQQIDQHIKSCTLAQANSDDICRIVATTNSLDDVWNAQLPAQAGRRNQSPHTTIFSGQVSTKCGAANKDVGPFYCPADHIIYIDPSFYQEVMAGQLHGSNDKASQEYVIAHEYGHHIQTELGDIQRSQQDPKGPSSGAVRVELQADCYAGLWFHYSTTTPARGGDKPLVASLTPQDITNVITTATAIGDDHIQKVGGGRVNPASWTHGSSEMRRQWFTTGYESGDMKRCDTFGAGQL